MEIFVRPRGTKRGVGDGKGLAVQGIANFAYVYTVASVDKVFALFGREVAGHKAIEGASVEPREWRCLDRGDGRGGCEKSGCESEKRHLASVLIDLQAGGV
jgi:hypothetical protein